MKIAIFAFSLAAMLSGCVSTPAQVAAKKPALIAHSNKTVSEVSGCIAPKIGKLWPFVQALPIEGGTRIAGDGSMSIPKTALVVDVTAEGNGSRVTYIPNNEAVSNSNEAAVKSCI
jgi:hypothetical protein